MKQRLSTMFIGLGILLGLLGAVLAFSQGEQETVLLKAPTLAREQAQTMLEAVRRGDYEAASSCLYGTPSLGQSPQDPAAAAVWKAMGERMTYELGDSFYADHNGPALDMTLTTLDAASVTGNLHVRVQALLEQAVEQAASPAEVYDENHDYRDDLVDGILLQAIDQALQEDAKTLSQSVTLHFVYENGRWWILPEEALLSGICGGVG